MDSEAFNALPATASAPSTPTTRDPQGRFVTGGNGGPGRPKGSRNKLAETFIDALAEDFAANGARAIEAVRTADPVAYLRIVTAVVGRDAMKLAVNIENQCRVMIVRDFGTDEEWATRLREHQARLVRDAAADG